MQEFCLQCHSMLAVIVSGCEILQYSKIVLDCCSYLKPFLNHQWRLQKNNHCSEVVKKDYWQYYNFSNFDSTKSFFCEMTKLYHLPVWNLPNSFSNVKDPAESIWVVRCSWSVVPFLVQIAGILWPISQQPPSSAVKRNIDLKSLPVSHPLNRRSVKCFRKSHYWFVIVKVFTLPKIVIIIQAIEKDVLK